MRPTYLITTVGISILLDGEHFVVPSDHINYDRIVECLKSEDYEDLRELIDVKSAVVDWMRDYPRLSVECGQIVLDGVPFGEAVSNKVFSMIEAGNEPAPLARFLTKVRANPSSTAQKELLLFCVANDFLIHESGDIIAYKAVRSDYMDSYSGTNRNLPGDVVTMDRGQVNDDRTVTCSHGLHFAAFSYASTFGGNTSHLMVIRVNPADVVSIPVDYNNEKGRCCRYTVVEEIKTREPLPKQEVYFDYDLSCSDDEDERDDEEYCPECGSLVDALDLNCPRCGAALGY